MADRPLTPADFSPLVGRLFEIDGLAEPLVLNAVTPLAQTDRQGGGFSLTFRGPRAPILEQATYLLRCDGQEHAIFLVPLGPGREGAIYEAVFN